LDQNLNNLSQNVPSRGKSITFSHRRRIDELGNYLFVLVPLLVVIILMVVPFFRTIFYSFTKFDGFSTPTFVGFKNYLFLGQNTHFLNAIKNNLLISLTTPLWAGVPLIVAVLLFQNQGKLLKTSRMTIMLPYALSMTVVGIMFRSLLNFSGPINEILTNMGLGRFALDWLGNVKFALPLIIITAIWKDLGVLTVIYLAGLSNLNKDLLDAAKIDGANWGQEFSHIIVPSLNPIIVFVTAMVLIGDFRYMFDYVYNMTKGGPGFATETIEFLLYNEGFRFYNFGFACTLGILIFIIIVIVTFLQIRIMTRRT
jgi:ABC-type sugar transport system permease subunit